MLAVRFVPGGLAGLRARLPRLRLLHATGGQRSSNPGIVLAAHDEIAIVYGTDAQQVTVPSTYQWSNGL